MATTTPDGIYYPISTTQIAPLETQFSTLATSVQTALTNKKQITVANAAALGALTLATYPNYTAYVSGNGTTWYNTGSKWELVNTPVVADATARDALYSGLATVSQGDTVFRNDLGCEQTYFAAYNASTNTGGRASAGWYNNQRNIGLVPIVPPTINVSGGTATANSLGLITFTGVTSISLNNVFSADYKNYRMVLTDVVGSVAGAQSVSVRFRVSGADNSTSNYYQYWTMKRLSGVLQDNSGGPSTSYALIGYDSSANNSYNWHGDINAPFANKNTTMTGLGYGTDVTSSYNVNSTILFNANTSFTGMTLFPSANALSGSVQIFGYNS